MEKQKIITIGIVEKDKDKVVEALEKLRKSICGYMQQPCDCKYGYDGPNVGEKTGCCELSVARDIIRFLTDKEYKEIVGRFQGILM